MKKMVLAFFVVLLIAPLYVHSSNPDSKIIPKGADVSLNSVYLSNPVSSVKVLGEKIPLVDDDEAIHFSAYNKDRTQVAQFIFHEGDIKNSFNEFNVTGAHGKISKSIRTLDNIDHFTTEKGIKLGLTKEDLIQILGKKFTSNKKDNFLTLTYIIDDFGKSKFLQHYNMPFYLGKYKLKDNKLIEFSFGFMYP